MHGILAQAGASASGRFEAVAEDGIAVVQVDPALTVLRTALVELAMQRRDAEKLAAVLCLR